MKKFEGILITSDLDGTLLNSDRIVSNENKEAIEYFKSEGGRFTFVTGRMPFFVSSIYDMVKPNAPIGCINGGGIYDCEQGKYLRQKKLPEKALELMHYVDDNVKGVGIQINTFEKVYFYRENNAMASFRRATGMPNLPCTEESFKEPIAKILFGDHNMDNLEKVIELLSEHPTSAEFNLIRSEKTLFEILPKNTDKGAIIAPLAEMLGIDINRTIAIGDYNNDIPMLRAAKLGIAVKNACPDAKDAADLITVSNDEHAIAQVIHGIENGSIKI